MASAPYACNSVPSVASRDQSEKDSSRTKLCIPSIRSNSSSPRRRIVISGGVRIWVHSTSNRSCSRLDRMAFSFATS